jgi:hypothetical protein
MKREREKGDKKNQSIARCREDPTPWESSVASSTNRLCQILYPTQVAFQYVAFILLWEGINYLKP